MTDLPPHEARADLLAVAICGAGHSGTTLLGLVLGSHSSAFYAGEAKKSRFIGNERKPLKKRVCKLCGPDCPVWSRFEEPPVDDLYGQLSAATGQPVVVDSTKNVDWLRSRADELDRLGRRHAVVFLGRDGRAVVNSRRRKSPDATPAELIDAWKKTIEDTQGWMAERPEPALLVRYEELATEPEATVRRVCAHLGLEFEPAMLAYETHEHHPLGGNAGTQSVVARASAAEGALASVPKRSHGYYSGLEGGFRLDLRWRAELPAEFLREFEERAGELNAPLRWDRDLHEGSPG